MIRKNVLVFCICSMVVFYSSCGHTNDQTEYHSVTEKYTEESRSYKSVSVSSELFFEEAKLIKVKEGEFSFLIPDRKGKLKMYACTECHTKPLAKMKSKDIKKAHWNINLKHADGMTMNCTTCHNSNNIDHLKSVTDVPIDFNKSYKLCSQCHSKQFSDWKGGAHGKRIGGWAPPRASLTCVNCHNPHQPEIGSKWPVRFNTQKVKERK